MTLPSDADVGLVRSRGRLLSDVKDGAHQCNYGTKRYTYQISISTELP